MKVIKFNTRKEADNKYKLLFNELFSGELTIDSDYVCTLNKWNYDISQYK
jgi:hypothetical protein